MCDVQSSGAEPLELMGWSARDPDRITCIRWRPEGGEGFPCQTETDRASRGRSRGRRSRDAVLVRECGLLDEDRVPVFFPISSERSRQRVVTEQRKKR